MNAVHLHARVSDRAYCDTECGLHCDAVDTAYRDLDPERVTCVECLELSTPPTGRSWREWPRGATETFSPAVVDTTAHMREHRD